MTPAIILAAMLRLAPFVGDRDETPEARAALYAPVADAIASTARTPEEAAALIADGYHESHYSRYVLESRCADGPVGARCDNGRARGAWQVWSHCRATDVVGEARCVLSQLRLGLQRCSSYEGGFAALGGASCSWRGAAPRVQMMRRVLAGWGQR